MDVKIDITKTTIETDRLILRAWKENDLNDFYEYARVDGVGEMAGWKHHSSMEETSKILKSFMSNKNVFAIVYKENDKVIGSLGLEKSWANDDENYKNLKMKEIGYVLSKDYWGMGLMPEAVKEVIKFGFNDCKLDAITISHFIKNIQSRRVIEKSGFKFVKLGKYYAKQLNQNFVDLEYILFKESQEL